MGDTGTTTGDPDQVPVAVAWARCMRDIGAIGKDSRNQAQNYSFRGVDALMNAAHPVFVRHGVAVIPTGGRLMFETHERMTTSNKASTATAAFVEQGFTILGPMGDTIRGATFGEGADTADKSTNKAMSAAYKYFLVQALCIPTLDMEEADRGDGANTPERAPKRAAAEKPAGAPTRPPRPTPPRVPPEGAMSTKQGALRDRVHGLPDAHRKQVAAHLTALGVDLRLPHDDVTVKAVGEYITSMPADLTATDR